MEAVWTKAYFQTWNFRENADFVVVQLTNGFIAVINIGDVCFAYSKPETV